MNSSKYFAKYFSKFSTTSKNVLSNSRGMTLVEIMIASALVLVIALVISELLVYSNRQQTRTEARSAVSELQQQITQQLRASPVPAAP
jgi:prepilin-type N-terminal cleavage/methylation domain-containing protein